METRAGAFAGLRIWSRCRHQRFARMSRSSTRPVDDKTNNIVDTANMKSSQMRNGTS